MSKLIKRLEQLESEIESGIRSVGKALMEIRDSKAYLGNYDTFEAYCKERWGFTDRHARDLIDAEAVRVKIGTLVPVETLKNKHLLEISKIPAAKQAQVAASVIADCEAENRKPTQKDFKDAAKEFVQPKADPKPEPKDDPDDEDAPSYAQTTDHWEDVPDEPEPTKPEPTAKEQAAHLKSIVKQHNAAMMRAIDDLHVVLPNTLCHDIAHKSFRTIHEVVEAWR
jgi:hypothetical protein